MFSTRFVFFLSSINEYKLVLMLVPFYYKGIVIMKDIGKLPTPFSDPFNYFHPFSFIFFVDRDGTKEKFQ